MTAFKGFQLPSMATTDLKKLGFKLLLTTTTGFQKTGSIAVDGNNGNWSKIIWFVKNRRSDLRLLHKSIGTVRIVDIAHQFGK